VGVAKGCNRNPELNECAALAVRGAIFMILSGSYIHHGRIYAKQATDEIRR
jgi:hypothetical protein